IKELEIIGLIKRENNKLLMACTSYAATRKISNDTMGKFHKTWIELLFKVIDEVDIERKYIVSNTFLVKKSDVPLIKERIEIFRRSLISSFESEFGEGEEVYQLGLALF